MMKTKIQLRMLAGIIAAGMIAACSPQIPAAEAANTPLAKTAAVTVSPTAAPTPTMTVSPSPTAVQGPTDADWAAAITAANVRPDTVESLGETGKYGYTESGDLVVFVPLSESSEIAATAVSLEEAQEAAKALGTEEPTRLEYDSETNTVTAITERANGASVKVLQKEVAATNWQQVEGYKLPEPLLKPIPASLKNFMIEGNQRDYLTGQFSPELADMKLPFIDYLYFHQEIPLEDGVTINIPGIEVKDNEFQIPTENGEQLTIEIKSCVVMDFVDNNNEIQQACLLIWGTEDISRTDANPATGQLITSYYTTIGLISPYDGEYKKDSFFTDTVLGMFWSRHIGDTNFITNQPYNYRPLTDGWHPGEEGYPDLNMSDLFGYRIVKRPDAWGNPSVNLDELNEKMRNGEYISPGSVLGPVLPLIFTQEGITEFFTTGNPKGTLPEVTITANGQEIVLPLLPMPFNGYYDGIYMLADFPEGYFEEDAESGGQ